MTGLGRTLVRLGQTAEADTLLHTALATSTARFGRENYRTAEAQLGLGEWYLAMHQHTDASASLEAARAILEPQRRSQPVLLRELEATARALKVNRRG